MPVKQNGFGKTELTDTPGDLVDLPSGLYLAVLRVCLDATDWNDDVGRMHNLPLARRCASTHTAGSNV